MNNAHFEAPRQQRNFIMQNRQLTRAQQNFYVIAYNSKDPVFRKKKRPLVVNELNEGLTPIN